MDVGPTFVTMVPIIGECGGDDEGNERGDWNRAKQWRVASYRYKYTTTTTATTKATCSTSTFDIHDTNCHIQHFDELKF
jgi:hypothetical protein